MFDLKNNFYIVLNAGKNYLISGFNRSGKILPGAGPGEYFGCGGGQEGYPLPSMALRMWLTMAGFSLSRRVE